MTDTTQQQTAPGPDAGAETDPGTGLTAEQVQDRTGRGLVNRAPESLSKSVRRIVSENVFTLFNLLNVGLALLVLMVGSYRNLLFILVIISNTVIGIMQELRAKRTIDRLSIMTAPVAHVVRDATEQDIPCERLVLDDVMVLLPGNQVCADSVLITGQSLSLDESLLTGEADPVHKRPGDALYSGSFVVSGSGRARVVTVGENGYASSITREARYFKKPNSQLVASLNRIIRTISYIIVPLGVLLFLRQFFLSGMTLEDAVVSTVASLIGMIPEGLILLTSVALAVGVVRLGMRRTLVQQLPSIETLARVDVLCLDKTGTITTGTMRVEETVPLVGTAEDDINDALCALSRALTESNATFRAISAHFAGDPGWDCLMAVPFCSDRKWSAAAFEERGAFVLGAPDVLFPGDEGVLSKAEEYATNGLRVLALARTGGRVREDAPLPPLERMALVVLSDEIREEAADTFRYFAEEGVTIKVISGDNPSTVSAVARRAGLSGFDDCIDMSALPENARMEEIVRDHTVFCRVNPRQKKELVKALQAQGHVVAMTGDGVNDVLALKEADCSIALASGSDATRHASQLVLLDSNFDSLVHVVAEGRRVLGNIERVATMYLVKTVTSIVLGLLFIVLPAAYPFFPIHLTLISTLTIGVPSFFLALEPNRERIGGHFLKNVLARTLPSAGAAVLGLLFVQVFGLVLRLPEGQVRTLSVLVMGSVHMMVFIKAAIPLRVWKAALLSAMAAGMAAALFFFRELFMLAPVNVAMVAFAAGFVLTAWPAIRAGERKIALSHGVIDRLFRRFGLG
jgi:cation-transporting ATPase E